jgi:hypothetical protein
MEARAFLLRSSICRGHFPEDLPADFGHKSESAKCGPAACFRAFIPRRTCGAVSSPFYEKTNICRASPRLTFVLPRSLPRSALYVNTPAPADARSNLSARLFRIISRASASHATWKTEIQIKRRPDGQSKQRATTVSDSLRKRKQAKARADAKKARKKRFLAAFACALCSAGIMSHLRAALQCHARCASVFVS